MSQSETPIFFTDECLGRFVPNALKDAGMSVEAYPDCFEPGMLDPAWIPIVVERGQVILTKDTMIGRRINEQVAIAQARAKAFMFASGNVKSAVVSTAFIKAYPKMIEIAETTDPPFIAKVYKSGEVKLWKDSSALWDVVNRYARDEDA